MTWISRSGLIIFFARGLRSFGIGFTSVLLGIYFLSIGFTPFIAGLLLSTSIAGGAIFTLIAGRLAARRGIRSMLLATMGISLAGIAVFLITDAFVPLLLASLFAFISPSSFEYGPVLSLEQAYLPFTVRDEDRTRAFTWWSIIGTLAASAGALAAGLPAFLESGLGLSTPDSLRPMFALYFLLNLAAFLLYLRIGEVRFSPEESAVTPSGWKIISRLSLLFSVDAFAGGLIVVSILSLWLYTRYGVSFTTLSAIFFVAGLLEAGSYYVSGILGKRFGLINTMVFTHIPSSIFLILVPFMPTFPLAILMYFLSVSLSEMDVPVRASYVVAIVRPEEKAITSAATNTARTVAAAFGPAVAGRVLVSTVLSPFVIAAPLKIAYDIAIFLRFRKIRPPEEITPHAN
jgi:MFS family permease